MKHKVIGDVGLTRRVVRKFMDEVNALTDEGWMVLTSPDKLVKKRGLRLVCQALLYKHDTAAGTKST